MYKKKYYNEERIYLGIIECCLDILCIQRRVLKKICQKNFCTYIHVETGLIHIWSSDVNFTYILKRILAEKIWGWYHRVRTSSMALKIVIANLIFLPILYTHTNYYNDYVFDVVVLFIQTELLRIYLFFWIIKYKHNSSVLIRKWSLPD